MRFWDSSALVPLLVHEPGSEAAQELAQADPEIVLWWGASVECVGALIRALREKHLSSAAYRSGREALEALGQRAHEVQPTHSLRQRAIRLLNLHPLSAADALQLAAALEWSEERPSGAHFVCRDGRLRRAAAREGFSVLPWGDEVHEPEP